jgi:hypothetical protein
MRQSAESRAVLRQSGNIALGIVIESSYTDRNPMSIKILAGGEFYGHQITKDQEATSKKTDGK